MDFENMPNNGADNATLSVNTAQEKSKPTRDYRVFVNVFAGLGVADSIGSILLALCFILLCWNAIANDSQSAAFLLILGTCGLWVSLGTSGLACIDGIVCFVLHKKNGNVGPLSVAAFVLGIVSFLLCWGTVAALLISGGSFL